MRKPWQIITILRLGSAPLPPGPQSVILRRMGPDKVRRESRDTVTIVLNSDRGTKPLVTLASPGMPGAVLSLPSPPTTGTLSPQRPSLSPFEITTMDVSGRLMVPGQSASGALVRFHLNNSLFASAEASGEGRVWFAIRRVCSRGPTVSGWTGGSDLGGVGIGQK